MKNKHEKETEKAAVEKQNQDYPNVPAATEKIKSEKTLKKQIRQTSALQPDGKTDNIEPAHEK